MKNFLFCLLICLFCAGMTEAKFTQNFDKKGLVPKSILKMDLQVQRTRTIGKVSEEAVLKYGTFDEYWKVCKTQATGKGFEGLAIETYNKGTPFVRRSLCSTAALKAPHDAADILKFNNITRRIQGKYQFKVGYSSTLKALRNTEEAAKYIDCTIVTASDTFQNIKTELKKVVTNHNRRCVPLPQKWQIISDAIDSGKLTGSIDKVVMPTRLESEIFTEKELRASWDKVEKLLASRQVEKISLKQTAKLGIKTSRFITKNILKTGGKYVTKGVVVVGYGYSVYEIYDTWDDMRHGRMDRDIAAARIGNATAQIAFETMGPVILTSLAVPGGGWIVAGIMATGTAGFIAVDMWISNVQARRNAENRRLLKQIDHKSRCEAAREVLKGCI